MIWQSSDSVIADSSSWNIFNIANSLGRSTSPVFPAIKGDAYTVGCLCFYALDPFEQSCILNKNNDTQIIFLIAVGWLNTVLGAVLHYNDVIMGVIASQIPSLTIVYPTVYSGRKSKKTSKLRVTGLCVGNSPVTGEFLHKGPVTRKMSPFDDVIMGISVIHTLKPI